MSSVISSLSPFFHPSVGDIYFFYFCHIRSGFCCPYTLGGKNSHWTNVGGSVVDRKRKKRALRVEEARGGKCFQRCLLYRSPPLFSYTHELASVLPALLFDATLCVWCVCLLWEEEAAYSYAFSGCACAFVSVS